MILASKILNFGKEQKPFIRTALPDKLLNPDFREIEDKLPEGLAFSKTKLEKIVSILVVFFLFIFDKFRGKGYRISF